MMFDLQSLTRPNIQQLSPYSCARDEFAGEASVMLDANENPYAPEFNLSDLPALNRYPDPLQDDLKQQIAEMKGVNPENVFLGVGSDEVLDLLIRVFCEPKRDSVIICPPSYGMYMVAASTNAVEAKEVPLLVDFQLDLEGILSAVDEQTKMIFLSSPNNPTGNLLKRDDIVWLCENFSGIVVLDEAYIDFAYPEASFVAELSNLPNLFILQTLSKAWGVAGIRLGMGFGSPEIISILNKVKAPYNINTLTSFIAQQVLEQQQEVQETIRFLTKERERVASELKNLPSIQKVYPSDANFLLVRVANAKEVVLKLAEQGVVVRYRGNEIGCRDCLRISIGTYQQNERLLQTLNEIL